MLVALVALISVAIRIVISEDPRCKCGPGDACWPSANSWNTLNSSVDGQLIANVPIAASCYPGTLQDGATCAFVDVHWTSQAFQANDPIGLSYPDDSCPPINASAGQTPGQICSIGTSPRFTVNATTPQHVAAAVNFARRFHIRLVIKDTGHDLLGRSTGYGSLSVWLTHLRSGLRFHKTYHPGNCSKSMWHGSAFTIGGGYTWEDVYPEAFSRNLIVVGGGTPTVGCLGGWMQGGGHGPAAHNYGLGADQVLSAVVVLASGQIVRVSPCSHPTLFYAIRGGGPGTYGVVIETTIKAYPSRSVTAIQLSLAPFNATGISDFIDALTTVYSAYPGLSKRGFSGYGSWSTSSPTPVIENHTASYNAAGFTQIYAIFDASPTKAWFLFSPLATKLLAWNGSLYIDTKISHFPTYPQYYEALSNVSSPIGQQAALGSRLLDQNALTGDRLTLRDTLQTLAGSQDEFTSNNIVFVGGGAVAAGASGPWSGVNPAWRTAYVHHIVARGWQPGSNDSVKDAVRDDITNVKMQALKHLAPRTGAYMNEADGNDPDFMQDFYGSTRVEILEGLKALYDPQSVFYCRTCIGSLAWEGRPDGRLCLTADGGTN